MEKRRRRLVAFVIGVILISVSVGALWYVYLRPLTIEEVLDWGDWNVGDSRVLYGRVTRAELGNTSFGPALFLTLDDHRWCTPTVIADPASGIRVGDTFRTTLHFTEVRLNGLNGIWAPEVVCLIPGYLLGMQSIVDAISYITGFILVYRGTQSGWAAFEVVTNSGDRYDAARLPVSLRKSEPLDLSPPDSAAEWADSLEIEYVRMSGWYLRELEIDTMASLSSGTSPGGRLEFVDRNTIGFLDDADEIRVRVDPSEGTPSYGTYFLDIGRTVARPNGSYVSGIKLLVADAQGPYQWAGPADGASFVQLAHSGDFVGPPVTSTLTVSDVRNGPPSASNSHNFTFQVGGEVITRSVADLPLVTPTGVRIGYVDFTGDGLMNQGDSFIFDGLANRTSVSFSLHSPLAAGRRTWITGYGPVVGGLPSATFAVTGGPSYSIAADVSWWHPELALGRTLSVTLRENGTTVVQDAALVEGTVGTFANGTLSWTDIDGDGFLSTGDAFALQGQAAATYEIEVSLLFGTSMYRATASP